MDHFRLERYEIKTASNDQLLVLVNGNRIYKQILSRAFPQQFVVRDFPDRFGRFEWGTYAQNVSEAIKPLIDTELELLHNHLFIQDDLTETFALDYHTESSPNGGFRRTAVGELVYAAKPYRRQVSASHRQAAMQLSAKLSQFVQRHPTYIRADLVMAVPPASGKTYDLPTQLAHQICVLTGMTDGCKLIEKVRATQPMKDCVTIPQKIENVRGAFQVGDADLTRGRSVILLDDIYQTGFTMNEMGRVLFAAGAIEVYGLVATKTGRDLGM